MKSLIPWKKKDGNTAPVLWQDDWFDRVLKKPFWGADNFSSHSFCLPSVEVIEDKNEVIVRAEIPGMTEKEIDLTWHDGALRISGEKKSEKEEKGKGRYYSECSYGRFSRDVPLRAPVDWKTAKARYSNGVLSVKLPKREDTGKAVEIQIN